MGLACRTCKGMSRLADGSECPVCMGGEPDPFPPIEVTEEFIPPVSRVEELRPSNATPDGRVVAGTYQSDPTNEPRGG